MGGLGVPSGGSPSQDPPPSRPAATPEAGQSLADTAALQHEAAEWSRRAAVCSLIAAVVGLVSSGVVLYGAILASRAASDARSAANEANNIMKGIREEIKTTALQLDKRNLQMEGLIENQAALVRQIENALNKGVAVITNSTSVLKEQTDALGQQAKMSQQQVSLAEEQTRLSTDTVLRARQQAFQSALEQAVKLYSCGSGCGCEKDCPPDSDIRIYLEIAEQQQRGTWRELSAAQYIKFTALAASIWEPNRLLPFAKNAEELAKNSDDPRNRHYANIVLCQARLMQFAALRLDDPIRHKVAEDVDHAYSAAKDALRDVADGQTRDRLRRQLDEFWNCRRPILTAAAPIPPARLPCWEWFVTLRQTPEAGLLSPIAKLTIENETGSVQALRVQGVIYQLPPGSSELWVSYGVLYTHLIHHEPARQWGVGHWKWMGRFYQFRLIIGYAHSADAIRPVFTKAGEIEPTPATGNEAAPLVPVPTSEPTRAPAR